MQRVWKEDLAWDWRSIVALLGEGEHRGGAVVAVQRDLLVDERARGAEEPAPFFVERHEVNLPETSVVTPSTVYGWTNLTDRVIVGDARDRPRPGLGLDAGNLQLAGFALLKIPLIPPYDRRSRHDGKRVRVHALVEPIEIAVRFEDGEFARGVGRRGQPVIGLYGSFLPKMDR